MSEGKMTFEEIRKSRLLRVKKVEYSAKAKKFLSERVSFPRTSSWDYTWIVGYRKLLRLVRVDYDLTRTEFEVLCYFASGKDEGLRTDVLHSVFGMAKRVWGPIVVSFLEKGYLEKVVCRADKYRVLPNGMDLLRKCEKFWKLEIAK